MRATEKYRAPTVPLCSAASSTMRSKTLGSTVCNMLSQQYSTFHILNRTSSPDLGEYTSLIRPSCSVFPNWFWNSVQIWLNLRFWKLFEQIEGCWQGVSDSMQSRQFSEHAQCSRSDILWSCDPLEVTDGERYTARYGQNRCVAVVRAVA